MSADSWSEILDQARTTTRAGTWRRLTRQALRHEAREGPPSGLQRRRVSLLGGATTGILEGPLRLALLSRGIAPDLRVAPYDQFMQEMIDPGSATSGFSPELAIVVNTPFNIPTWPEPGDPIGRALELAEQVCRHFLDPCELLHERCGTEVILNTFHPFPRRPLGNLGAKSADGAVNFVRRVNVLLGDLAPPYVHLNDVAWLAQRYGLDRWFDRRLWFEAKQPVSPDYVPEYASNTAAIAAGIFGMSRKCLVVDLDNTLWGGVIGDDGLGGIRLGEGDPIGEVYKEIQQHLKALRARGVLLAVVSKNEEATAVLPFEKHPETVLRPEDFVAFRANWRPKSDNLRELAAELDLGLESFVFLDDNPVEREEVRQALPQVAVPELSDDPSDFVPILDRAAYFETAAVTDEDRRRSDLYRSRSAGRALEARATDMSAFLASLEMRATISPFEETAYRRITQLINKTNQFNLTTRRLTRAEVEGLAADPAVLTRTVRLRDRFGDHGLIAVLSGRLADDVLDIDLWLMSCRVLKRGVERLLLNEVVRAAGDLGAREIRGTYIPSARNQLVRDHYRELGFSPLPSDDGRTRWTVAIDDFEPFETFISIDSTEASGTP